MSGMGVFSCFQNNYRISGNNKKKPPCTDGFRMEAGICFLFTGNLTGMIKRRQNLSNFPVLVDLTGVAYFFAGVAFTGAVFAGAASFLASVAGF